MSGSRLIVGERAQTSVDWIFLDLSHGTRGEEGHRLSRLADQNSVTGLGASGGIAASFNCIRHRIQWEDTPRAAASSMRWHGQADTRRRGDGDRWLDVKRLRGARAQVPLFTGHRSPSHCSGRGSQRSRCYHKQKRKQTLFSTKI